MIAMVAAGSDRRCARSADVAQGGAQGRARAGEAGGGVGAARGGPGGGVAGAVARERGARHAIPLRRAGGPQRADAGDDADARSGDAHRGTGDDRGRVGIGQGAGGASASQQRAARVGAVRERELQRDPGDAARGRRCSGTCAGRSRARIGTVWGCSRRADGGTLFRRRDRRDERGHAEQAAPGAAGG